MIADAEEKGLIRPGEVSDSIILVQSEFMNPCADL